MSIAGAIAHGALALSLPRAPRSESADETVKGSTTRPIGSTVARRYLATLRAGVREATDHASVRHVVLIAAVLMGVSAYDEYFGLLAREAGAATSDVAILMAVVTAGQVVGTALADRTASVSRRTMAWAVTLAGALIAAGAVSGHVAGIAVVAVGYGIAQNAMVVGEARVQTVISGTARATVTSTVGFSSEVFAVGCYGTFAIGSPWLSVGTLVAVLCVPLLAIAAAVRAWWPDPS